VCSWKGQAVFLSLSLHVCVCWLVSRKKGTVEGIIMSLHDVVREVTVRRGILEAIY